MAPYWVVRSAPPEMVATYAQMLEASGGVDYLWVWDVLAGLWPRAMWTPEYTPAAESLPCGDSWYDPWIMLGLAAATTKLNFLIGTNCIRQGPAEIVRAMLTLAGGSEGRRTICALGTGE